MKEGLSTGPMLKPSLFYKEKCCRTDHSVWQHFSFSYIKIYYALESL